MQMERSPYNSDSVASCKSDDVGAGDQICAAAGSQHFPLEVINEVQASNAFVGCRVELRLRVRWHLLYQQGSITLTLRSKHTRIRVSSKREALDSGH